MRTSLVTVALVAMASALITLGAVELLRATVAAVEPSAAETPPPRAVEPGARPASDLSDRLAALERRLAALELEAPTARAPVANEADEAAEQEGLRRRVLTWVAEQRAAEDRAAQLSAADQRREELEFDARFTAHMLAAQNDLPEWQEQKLAEVLLEIELRRDEIDASIDLTVDDPREVEARYVGFDEWAEQRLRDELGQELLDLIEG